jgi:hypothetical protein
VLLIRIRGLLKPLDPGFDMGKKSRSDPGMNIPHHISESLETFFVLKIFKIFNADPGSGIYFTLDPGWKNSIPG